MNAHSPIAERIAPLLPRMAPLLGKLGSPHDGGAAGVEVAEAVLAETQGAILPLVPYLDTLRWLFIAAALAGVCVAIYARIDDWKRGRR